jgi:putative membrane protein
MNRRDWIAGATVMVAFPAIAQTNSPPDDTTVPSGTTPSTAAPAPAEVLGLGDAEKQHVNGTMSFGTLSLEASKIALERAQSSKVKQFAQLETAEQETMADVFKAVKAAADDLAPAAPLTADENNILQKLQHGKATFDRDYVQAQGSAHHELLKIQEHYLSVGKNLTNRSIAQLASAMIKEHLLLLRDLEANG